MSDRKGMLPEKLHARLYIWVGVKSPDENNDPEILYDPENRENIQGKGKVIRGKGKYQEKRVNLSAHRKGEENYKLTWRGGNQHYVGRKKSASSQLETLTSPSPSSSRGK